jgi:hypothetical protein
MLPCYSHMQIAFLNLRNMLPLLPRHFSRAILLMDLLMCLPYNHSHTDLLVYHLQGHLRLDLSGMVINRPGIVTNWYSGASLYRKRQVPRLRLRLVYLTSFHSILHSPNSPLHLLILAGCMPPHRFNTNRPLFDPITRTSQAMCLALN